jgi:hypothetical protein
LIAINTLHNKANGGVANIEGQMELTRVKIIAAAGRADLKCLEAVTEQEWLLFEKNSTTML